MSVSISRQGRGYILEASTRVPRGRDEVFAFFADATNLDLLTPARLRFKVLTPRPIVMQPGLRIDYRLRLHGVPMRWQSEITVWEPPQRFVDEQRRGPYRRWVHEHEFREADGGTEVSDRVEYVSPGGALVHWLFVARDLRRIFAYRASRLAELFAPPSGPDGALHSQD